MGKPIVNHPGTPTLLMASILEHRAKQPGPQARAARPPQTDFENLVLDALEMGHDPWLVVLDRNLSPRAPEGPT